MAKCFISMLKQMIYTKFIPFILLAVFIAGCATPASRIDDLAQTHEFKRNVINTNGFAHLVYTRNLNSGGNVLRVYLEGDGTPWKYRFVTMPDPTSRDPLALKLMARDSGPVAYVGRPCYNGTHQDDGCNTTFWTSARYSLAVVRSMSAVIKQLVMDNGFDEVVLIGHSGGGALAMLIAPTVVQTTHVVTIAGNLDTSRWTKHHRYSRLYTSLNPAEQPNLSERVKQWHLVGGKDTIVPPGLVRDFVSSQNNALGISVDNFSHACCWERVWGDIARGIRTSSPGYLPGRRFKIPYQ